MRSDYAKILKILCGVPLLAGMFSVPTAQAEGVSVQAHTMFQSWKITDSAGEKTIDQWTVPINGVIPLQNDFELLFYAAGSANTLNANVNDYDLNGISDVRLQVHRAFAEDLIIIGAGVNLPTGKRDLDFTVDTMIVNQLSENFLSFPLRRFGQGFGFNLMSGVAGALGEFNASAGILYEFTGEYDPYQDQGRYNPGNLFTATISLSRVFEKLALSGNLLMTFYGADRFDDKKVFEQNTRLSFRLGSSYSAKAYRASLSLGYLLRGRNTRYGGDEVIIEQLQLFGDEFSARGSLDFWLENGWSVGPTAELRLVSGDELIGPLRFGSSEIYGFGGSVQKRISDGLNVRVKGLYHTGSADDNKLDVSGLSLSLSLLSSF